MSDPGFRAVRLVIQGRVQGVGFRESMRDLAMAQQIVGWVRNLRDGTVEALVQGSEDSLERLIVWAHRGPPGAHVTHVEASEVQIDQNLFAFVRLPTT